MVQHYKYHNTASLNTMSRSVLPSQAQRKLYCKAVGTLSYGGGGVDDLGASSSTIGTSTVAVTPDPDAAAGCAVID